MSGAPVRAAGRCTGRTPAPEPRAASSGRSLLGWPPRTPPPVLGRTLGPPGLGRWPEVARGSRAWATCAGRGASRIGGVPRREKLRGETRLQRPEDERDQRSSGTPSSAPGWVGSLNCTASSGLPRKSQGCRAWLPGGITPLADQPGASWGRGQAAGGRGLCQAPPRCPPTWQLRDSPSSVPARPRAGGVELSAFSTAPRVLAGSCVVLLRAKPVITMAFASWWYKTVNGSERPWAGPGGEGIVFALPFWACGRGIVRGLAGWGCRPVRPPPISSGEAPGEAQTHPAVVCGSAPGRASLCEQMHRARLMLGS